MTVLYSFEAKSIQAYVLEGGKLVDLVSASSLLDALINPDRQKIGDKLEYTDEVQRVINALEGEDRLALEKASCLRRAGGALIFSCDSYAALKKFRQAWTLTIAKLAPGLSYVDALLPSSDEPMISRFEQLAEQLGAARKIPTVSLPAFAPGMARAARTGRPAVHDVKERYERVDEATRAKRRFKADSDKGTSSSLGLRCVPSSAMEKVVFPNNFENDDSGGITFPFNDDNHIVGLVHADGNGLGKGIISLFDQARTQNLRVEKILPLLSAAIASATQKAVQAAFEMHVIGKEHGTILNNGKEVLPARPIVVGGDDITMLLRADLALEWTCCFLEAFMKETRIAITAAFPKEGAQEVSSAETALVLKLFGDGLSAGAGIAYVSASMPFDQVHHLCEGLASNAKKAAKSSCAEGVVAPSFVSIYRVTASALDDYDQILETELQASAGQDSRSLTMNPYVVEGSERMDAINKLRFADVGSLTSLAKYMNKPDFPNGPLREYVGLLESDAEAAHQVWQRFWHVANRRGVQKDIENEIASLLGAGWTAGDEPFAQQLIDEGQDDPSKNYVTPLLDAITLNSVSKEMQNNE